MRGPSNDTVVVLCDKRTVSLSFTREELLDLFTRCLQSSQDDTESSAAVLHKLAKAIDQLMQEETAAKQLGA